MANLQFKGITAVLLSGVLVACGGGGSNDAPSSSTNNNTQTNTNVQCELGQIKTNGVCRSAENICTVDAEKTWVRGFLDDAYLWYNEIPNRNANDYTTPQNYFDALLVKSKDRFSFTLSKAEAEGYYESGLRLGYGVYWAYDPDDLRVRFVEPNSLAAKNGIKRGDYVLSINNQNINNLNDEQISQLLTPNASSSVFVELTDVSKTQYKKIVLSSENLVTAPVPYYTVITNSQNSQDKIGYLLFNEHISTASAQLVAAINYFKEQKISDLVLDLRFNGGGYVYVANELAAMIGGNKTAGKLFQSYIFNQKWSPEYEYFARFSESPKQLLPYLNMSRVFVLTSNETCSASEAIINSLSPFMPVIRVGGETCGKPYGMDAANNCDTTYFAVTYKTENAYGQSVPTTGYAPTCQAGESFDEPLGSPQENLFANALYYRDTGKCFVSDAIQRKGLVNNPQIKSLAKPKWQQNMILLDKK